ncbi:MAG: hypothetical protein P4L52_01435 [Acidocella sp.]|nr:hypothetical protein [Acidocella sp.]
MHWSRKGAAILLAAVVFVTALPAFACLLGASPARHACCRHMTQECTAAMSASGSCCQARPQNPSTAPAVLATVEQAPSAAVVPHIWLAPPAIATSRSLAASNAPPPRFSPGAATSLRI